MAIIVIFELLKRHLKAKWRHQLIHDGYTICTWLF